MLNLKRIIAILILISVIALGLVFWRFFSASKPEELVALLPDDVELVLQDLHYTQNEEGRPSWTLDADKAEYLKNSSQVNLEAVSFSYQQSPNFGTIELKAKHGQLDQEQRQVDVWGEVAITTERGYQLFTERLHYDDQSRRLTGEDAIRVTSPQLQLEGIGLQLDIDKGRLLVRKNVRAVLQPAPGRQK